MQCAAEDRSSAVEEGDSSQHRYMGYSFVSPGLCDSSFLKSAGLWPLHPVRSVLHWDVVRSGGAWSIICRWAIAVQLVAELKPSFLWYFSLEKCGL